MSPMVTEKLENCVTKETWTLIEMAVLVRLTVCAHECPKFHPLSQGCHCPCFQCDKDFFGEEWLEQFWAKIRDYLDGVSDDRP